MNIAAEARIEEYVPAGVAIVVININAVAVPIPIAAASNVIGRDDPIRLVVENDMPRTRVEPTDDNDLTNIRVTPARIVVTGANALAIVIPIAVIILVVLVP